MEGKGPGVMTVISVAIASIIGLAIVSVIVSKNSNTSGVITGGGTALSSVIQAAVAPVSSAASGTLG